MGIGRRQPHGQGEATAVDQQVVLGPGLAAVCRVRAGQAAPARHARSTSPGSPATSPAGRRGRADPTAPDAAAARRRRAASHAAAASR
jgi:hypothetical protein